MTEESAKKSKVSPAAGSMPFFPPPLPSSPFLSSIFLRLW
jgi:hypothetical protein